MNDEIKLDIQDHIALVTINRPEQHNTISFGVLEGLGAAYERCDSDDDVRVVVLTGAGSLFCAGADMSQSGDTFNADVHGEVDACPLSMQAWDVRKPIIAACNGHAVGAGLGLAMQADMRVLANEGKYGFLQVRRGVVPDFAIEYVLPRIVGFETAFELLMRGEKFTGEQALAKGLAGRSVPQAEVLDTALEIAGDMAVNSSPLVAGMIKRLLWRGLDCTLPQLAELETKTLNHSMRLPDGIEGSMAYIERRAPNWTGSVNDDWPEGV